MQYRNVSKIEKRVTKENITLEDLKEYSKIDDINKSFLNQSIERFERFTHRPVNEYTIKETYDADCSVKCFRTHYIGLLQNIEVKDLSDQPIVYSKNQCCIRTFLIDYDLGFVVDYTLLPSYEITFQLNNDSTINNNNDSTIDDNLKNNILNYAMSLYETRGLSNCNDFFKNDYISGIYTC